jgi:long-chain acyl-CoA synthetase
MRTLDEAVDLLAARGDATAFRLRTEFRSLPMSGGEAARRALRMAAVLGTMGVGRGDRVLLRAPNGPDWGLALLAVLRLGAVAVPLDAKASLAFTRTVGEKVRAKAAILSRRGAPGPADLPTLLLEEAEARGAREKGPDPGPLGLAPSDVAQILFTSGTTGDPKGVVLTHGNIAANVESLARLAPFDRDFRFLSLLPLSHMFEQTVGFFLPILGGCTVIYLDVLKPSAVARAFREERITCAVMVPRILKGLKEGIERETATGVRGALFRGASSVADALPHGLRRLLFAPVHRRFGGRVRFLFSGGAPLEAEVEDTWERMGFVILQGYGLTETSPVLTCGRPGARRRGSPGLFLENVEHRIEESGEVAVRGPSIFGGYFEDPVKTAEVLRDGWFHTGDLGEVREGFLFLKGRSKDLIKSPGGLNIYPEDVEAALRAVAGVKEACVFPCKGPRGEEVAAALLPFPGTTLDPRAVAAEANAHLEEGRGVARAVIWPGDDFPRTATLKVQKFKVRQAVEAGGLEEGPAAAAGSDDPVRDSLSRYARVPVGDIVDAHRLGADLGLDSMDMVDLVSTLEERLRIDVDEGEVTAETTVGALRALLERRGGASDDGLPGWPRGTVASAFRWAFRHLLLLPLFRTFVTLEVRGLEHLDGLEGPVLFTPNHTSHLDAPALLHALPPEWRRRTALAAWAEYFEPAQAGLAKRLWLRSLRLLLTAGLPMVPVTQSRAFRRSLRNVGTMLDAGWNVVFFPEGERTRTAQRLPFQKGVGIVAGSMRATVVPVRVEGLMELLPRDSGRLRRGKATLTFGPPLRFSAEEDVATIVRRVEAAVDALRD